MTDQEIIRAFEGYKYYDDKDITRSCEKTVLLKEAYFLMERQQAEIERLKQEQVFAKAHYGELEWQHITLCEEFKTAKSSAIKEFVEKLKKYHYKASSNWSGIATTSKVVDVDVIDNLVKEMEVTKDE